MTLERLDHLASNSWVGRVLLGVFKHLNSLELAGKALEMKSNYYQWFTLESAAERFDKLAT